MKKILSFMIAIMAVMVFGSYLHADNISVNFHVGDDADAQAAHEFDGTETAGVGSFNTSFWNNVGIGAGGTNTAAAQIFAPATLFDDSGNSSAATLTSTLTSGTSATWFGGYAASAALIEAELTNGISDDNLFNSYLALNGPNGDGSPTDNFVLDIAGLGLPFTANGYDLIIYSDTDRGPTSISDGARTSVFTVTEAGGTVSSALTEDDNSAPRVFDGNYILSDGNGAGTDYSNYTVISGLSASSFSIEVTSPNGGRGGISGFQIVATAVPEPTSAALLGLGGLGLVLRRRRS